MKSHYNHRYLLVVSVLVAAILSITVNSQVEELKRVEGLFYADLIAQTKYIVDFGLERFCIDRCISNPNLNRCAECPQHIKDQFQDKRP
ncbi:unnamed protein product [Gordionus sp. m RMFG-2023]